MGELNIARNYIKNIHIQPVVDIMEERTRLPAGVSGIFALVVTTAISKMPNPKPGLSSSLRDLRASEYFSQNFRLLPCLNHKIEYLVLHSPFNISFCTARLFVKLKDFSRFLTYASRRWNP
jgi:hypothetical protein